MMEISGLVLRITPYKENDAMILSLTQDGYLSFLARGVMKINSKNAPSIGLYSFSKWDLETGKNGQLTLKNGQLITSMTAIMDDLPSLLAMDAIAEICLKMVIDDEKYLYPYLIEVFRLLRERRIEPASALAIIAAQVLKLNGYGLVVDGCVFCHDNKKIVSFDYQSGGFVCAHHFDPLTMVNQSTLYLKTVRLLFLFPYDYLDKVALDYHEVILILSDFRKYLYEACGFKWSGLDAFFKAIKSI